MIYFDHAATSFQKPKTVRNAVLRAMQECASPGRGGYRWAMNAAQELYDCRVTAGEVFSCPAENVVFTMNATHGLNMAITSVVKPGSNVVISGFEHNAVWRPLHKIGANIKIAGRKLFDPEATLREFEEAVNSDTDAVICTHVSNVFGYILPVQEIAELCRERNVPIVLDASQSAGILPVSMKDLGAAFIAMPGHKGLYGPQGTGLLLCSQIPEVLISGGTGSLSASSEMPDFLPDRGEAGTHNVPGICGLLAGMRFVEELGAKKILTHEQNLCRRIVKNLSSNKKIQIFSDGFKNQAGVLSVNIDGIDCECAAEFLAEHDCAVRAGLHCSPLAHESAGTLESGTIRISPSAFSTEKQADVLSEMLLACAERKK